MKTLIKRGRWTVRLAMLTALAAAFVSGAATAQDKPSLVERLGFPKDARVLIVNGDDFGMNHATNVGSLKALKSGGMTSTTVMTPCGWFMEAVDLAKKNPKANVGVHTVLTSEWGRYKWGPVVGWQAAPSLCDDFGYFFTDVPLVYLSAKMDEVEKEIRAQVDRALRAGIDVTHIDSHMGTMQSMPGYHELYVRIAKDYNLPARIAGRKMMEQYGGGYLIDQADELGVLHPDELFMGDPPSVEATETWWKDRILQAEPGKVTEIYIHCAVDDPEMHATTGSTRRRVADTNFFSDPATLAWMKEQGIELISYRELRELQRTGKPIPRVEHYGWE